MCQKTLTTGMHYLLKHFNTTKLKITNDQQYSISTNYNTMYEKCWLYIKWTKLITNQIEHREKELKEDLSELLR